MAVEALTIKERQEVGAQQEVIRNRIVIWYHESDIDQVKALDPHLQLLALRMGVVLHYFGYPFKVNKAPAPLSDEKKKYSIYVQEYEEKLASYEKTQKERQDRYNGVITTLQQHCVVFVPCISNDCMVQLWKDTEQDERLNAVFTEPPFKIMPVTIRPTNIGETNAPDPLSAYTGHHLDAACMNIAIRIEQALRARFQPRTPPIPTLLLPEPARSVVDTPKKRWWSLFH